MPKVKPTRTRRAKAQRGPDDHESSGPFTPVNARPLTSFEAAGFFSCTARTLHNYRKAGLPYFRLNQRVFRYYQRDLERWLIETNRV